MNDGLASHALWFVEQGAEILSVDRTKRGSVTSAKSSVGHLKDVAYGIRLGTVINGKRLVGWDLDTEHGGPEDLKFAGFDFSKTVHWKSGGGKGYGILTWIRADLDIHGVVLVKGLELRTTNKYLVGPGSSHPSGGMYGERINDEILDVSGDLEIAITTKLMQHELSVQSTESSRPDRLFKSPKWVEKFSADPQAGKRSTQTFDMLSFSAQMGADEPQLLWILKNFKPALDKGLHKYPAREISNAIALHYTHLGTPCREAGCLNNDWMKGGVIAEFDIWNHSPILRYIYDVARLRRVPPKAVLMSVLAHIGAAIPTEFVLPPIIGDPASLNTIFAFVGASGECKGTSTKLADKLFDYSQTQFEFKKTKGGSGEGLVADYAYWDAQKEVQVDRAKSLFININEIDELAATAKINSSTLISTLRLAWSGEELGQNYRSNRTRLPELTYRLSMQIGAQPLKSQWLVNDTDGGLTQRVTFVPTNAQHAHPDEELPEPVPVEWAVPKEIIDLQISKKAEGIFGEVGQEVPKHLRVAKSIEIKVAAEVQREILIKHWERSNQKNPPAIESQYMLNREKIALLIAALHGKLEINEESWQLSSVLMSWHWSAYKEIEIANAKKAKNEREQKLASQDEARTTGAQKAVDRMDACKDLIIEHVESGLKWKGEGHIYYKLRNYRDIAVAARNELITEGRLKFLDEKQDKLTLQK